MEGAKLVSAPSGLRLNRSGDPEQGQEFPALVSLRYVHLITELARFHHVRLVVEGKPCLAQVFRGTKDQKCQCFSHPTQAVNERQLSSEFR